MNDTSHFLEKRSAIIADIIFLEYPHFSPSEPSDAPNLNKCRALFKHADKAVFYSDASG
jgi:hypothetical protein